MTSAVGTALPNLIVIGAAKCGTTSLHGYLDEHPDVQMARPRSAVTGGNDDAPKEMRFFWRDDWRDRLPWYSAHFDADVPVRGEATPAYAAHPFHSGVPARIAEVTPDARLVYVVGDPVERLVAHWVQARVDGLRTPLERLIGATGWEDHQIVCPSRYATQLDQYRQYFALDRILVIDQDDLRAARRETLERVFAFAGVDPRFWSDRFDHERNTFGEKRAFVTPGGQVYRRLIDPAGRNLAPGSWSRTAPRVRRALSRPVARPELSPAARERLEGLLAPEAARLRALVGQPFAGWSV